jgi:hypothetical protein
MATRAKPLNISRLGWMRKVANMRGGSPDLQLLAALGTHLVIRVRLAHPGCGSIPRVAVEQGTAAAGDGSTLTLNAQRGAHQWANATLCEYSIRDRGCTLTCNKRRPDLAVQHPLQERPGAKWDSQPVEGSQAARARSHPVPPTMHPANTRPFAWGYSSHAV